MAASVQRSDAPTSIATRMAALRQQCVDKVAAQTSGIENFLNSIHKSMESILKRTNIKADSIMCEAYWPQKDHKVILPDSHCISYFSKSKSPSWFSEPEFAKQVARLHEAVGNAVTEKHCILVRTGLIQLLQAAFYALSPPDSP